MTMNTYAPTPDTKTFALGRLVATLAEDAMFGISTGGGTDVLEGLGRRRGEAYSAVLAGHRLNTMSGSSTTGSSSSPAPPPPSARPRGCRWPR